MLNNTRREIRADASHHRIQQSETGNTAAPLTLGIISKDSDPEGSGWLGASETGGHDFGAGVRGKSQWHTLCVGPRLLDGATVHEGRDRYNCRMNIPRICIVYVANARYTRAFVGR